MSSHPRQAPERSAWLVSRYYFSSSGLRAKDDNVLITVLVMLAVILESATCTCSLKFVDVDMA